MAHIRFEFLRNTVTIQESVKDGNTLDIDQSYKNVYTDEDGVEKKPEHHASIFLCQQDDKCKISMEGINYYPDGEVDEDTMWEVVLGKKEAQAIVDYLTRYINS